MGGPVTEFVYLQLKPTVQPEDPKNEPGQQFLSILHGTKQQNGYIDSAWGRTLEDENILVWAINWVNPENGGSRGSLFGDYIEPNSRILRITTTLTPPPTTTESFTKNPITELWAVNFPSSHTPDEHRAVDYDLINFRTALLEKAPAHLRPVSWSMGQAERPGLMDHSQSPSGKVYTKFLVVGWSSKEVHMEAKKTQVFSDAIEPLRKSYLPSVHNLGLKHVSFKKL